MSLREGILHYWYIEGTTLTCENKDNHQTCKFFMGHGLVQITKGNSTYQMTEFPATMIHLQLVHRLFSLLSAAPSLFLMILLGFQHFPQPDPSFRLCYSGKE